MKVFLQTLGCKTNQYETQGIRETLLAGGLKEAQEEKEADLFVINTCTVTGEGDRKSRYLIRRLNRINPKAKIVVTGCYAEMNAREIEGMRGVSLCVPNRRKTLLAQEIFSRWRISEDGETDLYPCKDDGGSGVQTPPEDPPLWFSISRFEGRTRAFIKIQDGCDHACTYCKVVLVRGRSRSRPWEEILAEAKRLRDQGYREIVLTGIQLGAYGDEWKDGVNLADLLEKLTFIEGIERIRLSSIDPSDVTDLLMQTLKSLPKVCPHFHLPLQSGDDSILSRMRRAYRSGRYLEIVEEFRSHIPDFILSTDVMVGFPGETDRCFENTLSVIRKTRPYKMHIFPFSPREGTQAAAYQERIDEGQVKRRIAVLNQSGGEISRSIALSYLDREVKILVEEGSAEKGMIEGSTSNYFRVRVKTECELKGFVSVRLISWRPNFFDGVLLSP